MQTFVYILITLVVVVIATKALVRKYKRYKYLNKLANFYLQEHWFDEEKWWKEKWLKKNADKLLYGNLYNDPLRELGYINGSELYSYIDEIVNRFRKDHNFLKETEDSYKESEKEKILKYENERKRDIVERAFAYDYEELLFRIYEPTAEYDGIEWRPGLMTKEEVLQRIIEIKNISRNEAEDIFKILVDHNLIWYYAGSCDLTVTLRDKSRSHIISKTDMNFNRWMKIREDKIKGVIPKISKPQ